MELAGAGNYWVSVTNLALEVCPVVFLISVGLTICCERLRRRRETESEGSRRADRHP
jgi:hypothetical protein